tara:strand:- start:1836 stop:2156 length:321 start_codon:yes stop_codon:yes gene_type:complete
MILVRAAAETLEKIKKKYLLKTFIVAFIKILLYAPYVKLYLASYIYICPYEIDQVSSKNIRLRLVICGDIYTYIYTYIVKTKTTTSHLNILLLLVNKGKDGKNGKL